MSDSQPSALFQYPEHARFGANLPKTLLYQKTGANTSLKRLFIDEVAAVRWSWKLDASLLNLRASEAIEEIHVLSVDLKGAELNLKVLEAIDRAIPHYTIFELRRTLGDEQQISVAATYKRPFKNDARRVVLSRYYVSPWYSADTPRTPLPTAVDLERLYELLLMRLIPVRAKPDETLEGLVHRADTIAKKERELERLESRMWREKQFNRKVALNQEVHAIRNELNALRG